MAPYRTRRADPAAGQTNDRRHATEQLEAQLAQLDAEIAETSKRLADRQASGAEAERRAIDAIRASDDRDAWAALIEQKTQIEQAALLAADLDVLRVLADECRAVLSSADAAPRHEPPL